MANVVKFPTKSVRDWVAIERSIREVLTEVGASNELIDDVCPRMKEYYERYNNLPLGFKTELPAGMDAQLSEAVHEAIAQGVEGIARQIHNLTNHALLDLLRKEIELFNLRTGHPDAG